MRSDQQVCFFTAMHMTIYRNTRICFNYSCIYCASIWPWFAVNDLLYIFVILYKTLHEKKFLNRAGGAEENYNIGYYVCIPVILLSLGIYLSSTENIETNKKIKIYTTVRNGIFNIYRNIFIIYKLEKRSD